MITDRQAVTPELYVGKSGTFWGHNLSDNKPTEATGTVTDLKEASWVLVTIKTKDGIKRLRIA